MVVNVLAYKVEVHIGMWQGDKRVSFMIDEASVPSSLDVDSLHLSRPCSLTGPRLTLFCLSLGLDLIVAHVSISRGQTQLPRVGYQEAPSHLACHTPNNTQHNAKEAGGQPPTTSTCHPNPHCLRSRPPPHGSPLRMSASDLSQKPVSQSSVRGSQLMPISGRPQPSNTEPCLLPQTPLSLNRAVLSLDT